jgi:hypothetical protein
MSMYRGSVREAIDASAQKLNACRRQGADRVIPRTAGHWRHA